MAATKTATIKDVVSDDLNYEIWAMIVKTRLVEKGLWDVVENGIPPNPSKIPELATKIQAEDLSKWRDYVGKDTKALQILQSALPDSVFRKTLETASAKDLWDLLKEANEQVKLEKKRIEEGDCSSMDSKRVMRSRHERGECSQCGGKGHIFKDCSNRKNQSRNELPEYEMLSLVVGPVTFDEDMWMIYNTTNNHMTPYIKYFTNLDRSYRAKIKFIIGSSIMSEGMGDVSIMTKEGKITMIKNVLYVPGIDRNVLSAGQMTQLGYRIVYSFPDKKCTIKDPTGRLFAESMMDERGFFSAFAFAGH